MKLNTWIKVVAIVVSLVAIYIAFDIRRGISHHNRGANYMAEGEYDKAIECFGEAIRVKSKFPEAYCHRGVAYYEKRQYDQAIRDFDRAIELRPEYAEAYHNRAMVYYSKKQYDQAWDDVNKAQSLGHSVSSNLLEALQEATGREY
jgi:tetratricopeptide (TPR) repeat protein